MTTCLRHILIAFALLALGAPAAHAATEQWRFGSESSVLYRATPVRVSNTQKGSYLVYFDRNGIDLDWRSSSAPEWTIFRPCSKTHCTIHYNEFVALYNEAHGRFMKYGSTGARGGINLVWSQTPDYEWSIRGLTAAGDQYTSGTPVTGEPNALFNTSASKYVVQGPRPWYERNTVDLVWASAL
jgi:hypothetical protein